MRFHLIDVELKSCLGGLDKRLNDAMGLDLADTHTDKLEQAHANAGSPCRDRKSDGNEAKEEDKNYYHGNDDADDCACGEDASGSGA